ncbi:hypothetical protein U1Q18_033668, partial [Sarracenia purpurea var. burkii]
PSVLVAEFETADKHVEVLDAFDLVSIGWIFSAGGLGKIGIVNEMGGGLEDVQIVYVELQNLQED